MDMADVEASAVARDEQIGGDRVTEELLASLEVVGQDRAGRRVARHLSPLAELGAADRQDRVINVDVGKFEVQRLGQAQARHAEQAEQPGALQCHIQPPPDLVLGVHVRPGARRSVRQQAEWRYLGAVVGGAAMAGEAAHEAKPSCPLGRLDVGLLSPPQRA